MDYLVYTHAMVRTNKTPLSMSQVDALFAQLAGVVAPTHADHANAVLSEILGNEEKLMLAKRIAVIVLLHENVSHYKISRILKLSITTISKIAEQKADGSYTFIVSTITKSKRGYMSILEALDAILTLGGVLPYYGHARIGASGFKRK